MGEGLYIIDLKTKKIFKENTNEYKSNIWNIEQPKLIGYEYSHEYYLLFENEKIKVVYELIEGNIKVIDKKDLQKEIIIDEANAYPVVSSNGKYIAYWKVHFKNPTIIIKSTDNKLLFEKVGLNPCWLSDGNKVVFSAKKNLYIYDLKKEKLFKIDDGLKYGNRITPAISPDGKRIACDDWEERRIIIGEIQ